MNRAFDRLCNWLGTQIGRSHTFVATLAMVCAGIAAGMVPAWREAVNTWAGAVTGYLGVLLLFL